MKINLLIVEDAPSVVKQWEEKLRFYAIEDQAVYVITPTYAFSLSQAEKLLENTKFDAAVIDIRLDEDGKQTDNGNAVLKKLSDTSLTICAVYTGELGTEKVQEHQIDFVKVFVKGDGDGIEQMLAWLDNKVDMLSAIQAMQESFNKSMAKAFTRSIWPRWSHWLNSDQEQGFAEKALTRHMATHLHASFLNEAAAAHPEEYYFIPPLQERLDTGDIFKINEEYFILVTPRCDLAQPHSPTPTFQLVKLTPIQAKWQELHAEKSTLDAGGKKKGIESSIRKLINHGDRSSKLHFIPQIKLASNNILGPFHAQFNFMNCMEASQENIKALTEKRIATLSNEFVPSLVERLGAYFSRIGTPDYSHPE